MTPEPEIGSEGLVAHVANERLDGAQELLVTLQLLAHRENLPALLTGPQAGVFVGDHFLWFSARFTGLFLYVVCRLLLDLDFKLLGNA